MGHGLLVFRCAVSKGLQSLGLNEGPFLSASIKAANVAEPLLGGSGVVRSGVLSRVTILITHIGGLITPLMTTPEPLSIVLLNRGPRCCRMAIALLAATCGINLGRGRRVSGLGFRVCSVYSLPDFIGARYYKQVPFTNAPWPTLWP